MPLFGKYPYYVGMNLTGEISRAVTSVMVLFSFSAHADIFSQTFGEETPESGQVIVERPIDLSGPYKERRRVHGGLFSINYEKYYPVDYGSQFTNNGYVEDIIGSSPIDMVGVEAGYKHNFQFGSIAVLGGFSQGSSAVSGDIAASQGRLLVDRTVFSVSYAMDAIFEEPWVVPYAQGGIYNMTIREQKGELYESKSSGYALNYRLGLLFQLNWIEKSIDPSTQIDGLRSTGLQNTFIDVFYISHLASQDAADPSVVATTDSSINTRSDGQMGIGLKIEF